MDKKEMNEKSLRDVILDLDDGMSAYCGVDKDYVAIKLSFAGCIYMTATTIVEELKAYVDDLNRHVCKESLCLNFDKMTSVDYWMKGGKLKSDMEKLANKEILQHDLVWGYIGFFPHSTMELYDAIEKLILEIVEILKEVDRKIDEAPLTLYGNFYRYQKSLCDRHAVEAEYRKYKRDVRVLTYDLLKDKQVYEIEKHLKKKILRHMLVPSDREVEQIDLGKMNKHLPYGYVIPEELKKCYARLYRFVTQDGDTLKINHDLYGNYLFQHYYKLTPEERQALFDFDIMLEMINQDIAQYQPSNLQFKGTQSVEDRIRHCIALLMAEKYGNEYLFNLQGHWQAVYRILVDKGYCMDSDFNGFDAFIEKVMPENVNKPYKHDSVRNINKTDFNRAFDKWEYNADTSGKRIPYDRMVALASRFKAILEQNNL